MRIYEIFYHPKGPQNHDWRFAGLFVANNEHQALAEARSVHFGTDIDADRANELHAEVWNGDRMVDSKGA